MVRRSPREAAIRLELEALARRLRRAAMQNNILFHPSSVPAPMHDWSKFEARQAASLRHQRALRPHTGYPRSSGVGLRVLCECGMDCGTVNDWERHLLKIIEETVE